MATKRVFMAMLLIGLFLAGAASAAVNVNINIGTPLPEVVVAAPPALAVVPGTYVYVATDVNANMVFYQDNWYRSHGSGWYASLSYNGPWKAVSAPPAALMSLPQNYHVVPAGRERMPYGQVKDNWRTWERDRHWDDSAMRDERSGDDEHERKHHKKHKKHHDEDDDHDDDRGQGKHKHDD